MRIVKVYHYQIKFEVNGRTGSLDGWFENIPLAKEHIRNSYPNAMVTELKILEEQSVVVQDSF